VSQTGDATGHILSCFNQPNVAALREARAAPHPSVAVGTYQATAKHPAHLKVCCLWHTRGCLHLALNWFTVKNITGKELPCKSSGLSWCLKLITIPPYTLKKQQLSYFC